MPDLTEQLEAERIASYIKLKGGFPVLFAGATYWGSLTVLGYTSGAPLWHYVALFGSGAIFPLALFYARIFRNDFTKERTSVTGVFLPAFVSMLLFWPMAIAALWQAIELFPLILAIGLSLHFPVIGWSYAKTFLYSSHAVIRAIVVFVIWWQFPQDRLTLLPLAVMLTYLVTAFIVIIDSQRTAKRSRQS